MTPKKFIVESMLKQQNLFSEPDLALGMCSDMSCGGSTYACKLLFININSSKLLIKEFKIWEI